MVDLKKCVWDTSVTRSSKDVFLVFTGNDNNPPMIIDRYDHTAWPELVILVPNEYRTYFERNIYEALWALCGISMEVINGREAK